MLLFIGETDKQLPSPGSLPFACNDLGGPGLYPKLGARNAIQLSHESGRHTVIWVVTTVSQSLLAETWSLEPKPEPGIESRFYSVGQKHPNH